MIITRIECIFTGLPAWEEVPFLNPLNCHFNIIKSGILDPTST